MRDRASAPRVTATTLLMAGAPGTVLDGQALKPLVAALAGEAVIHESEQSLYRDGLYAEQWMAAKCQIRDVQSILPEQVVTWAAPGAPQAPQRARRRRSRRRARVAPTGD